MERGLASDIQVVHTPQAVSSLKRVNVLFIMLAGSRTDPRHIWSDSSGGLDFRFCTTGFFGRAAYFSERTAYCDNSGYKYCGDDIPFPRPHNLAQLFVVRVAAGLSEQLQHSVATEELIKPGIGYHSVRGNVDGRTMAIMTYECNQAYPAYLVTYETRTYRR
jgi:hypothetical protein